MKIENEKQLNEAREKSRKLKAILSRPMVLPSNIQEMTRNNFRLLLNENEADIKEYEDSLKRPQRKWIFRNEESDLILRGRNLEEAMGLIAAGNEFLAGMRWIFSAQAGHTREQRPEFVCTLTIESKNAEAFVAIDAVLERIKKYPEKNIILTSYKRLPLGGEMHMFTADLLEGQE